MTLRSVRGLILPPRVADELQPDYDGFDFGKKAGGSGKPIFEIAETANPGKLAAYLAFWDRLAVLDDGRRYLRLTHDEQFLEREGVLSRLESSPLETNTLRHAQFGAFEMLERDEPGIWAVASESAPTQATGGRARTILVSLFDVLPVPDRTVPLAEILHFRERRKIERDRLRNHLELLYQCILGAADGTLALRTQIEALSSAVRDYLNVSEEAGLRPRLAACEARLKWEFSPHLALGGAAIGGALGDIRTAIVGALAGLSSNLLPKIEVSLGSDMEATAKANSPFEYIVQLDREL